MSKKTLYLLGIVLAIVVGTWLYHMFCCHRCEEKSCCSEKGSTMATAAGNYSAFSLRNGDFNYQCYDNFKFKNDNFSILEPVCDSINNGIALLKNQFDQNPNQKLTITGYCTQAEKNTSAFPNLGFARANAVKNYLVSKGIPSDKLDINGEVKDSWTMQGDTVLGPVSYLLENNAPASTAAPADDLDALKAKINANPLILYFNTNQAEINLTAEERQKVADIVNYLDKVPAAKISCMGHTDNVGNRNKNVQLGQERAEFAKSYLVKNGISADKIVSTSKGPDEPIADNATAEGKAKNRRTVVSLQ